MPRIKDQIIVGANHLNTDDDPRFFQNGETDYRRNAAPFGDGTEGVVTNMKGNEQITHDFSHSNSFEGANYTVIGGCYDEKRNAYYYFIYSNYADNGNDSIIRYNIDDGSFDRILWDAQTIGLDIDYPITDAFVMGDYLFFNTRDTYPRMLNIEWCTNYFDYTILDDTDTAGSYDSGDKFRYLGRIWECLVDSTDGADLEDDIKDGEFKLCKWTGKSYCIAGTPPLDTFYNIVYSPIYPLAATYGNDSSVYYNNLLQKAFQFSYRYVYHDGRTSLYAPYSDVAMQLDNENYFGAEQTSFQTANKLSLQPEYHLGYQQQYINYVEIVFRVSTDTGWGTWKKAGRLNWNEVYNDSAFEFYNEGNYEEVDQDEVARQYQNLPLTAKAQVPLKNRVGYVGVTEGYDNIVPFVDLTEEFIKQESIVTGSGDSTTYTIDENTTGSGDQVTYDYDINIPGVPTANYYLILIIGVKYTLVIPDPTYGSTYAYATALASFIEDNVPNIESATGSASSVNIVFVNNRISLDGGISAVLYEASSADYQPIPGFKFGAKHGFCLFYYDALGIRTAAIESSDLEIYLPTIMEQSAYSPTDADILRYNIGWTIKHLPPTWASYWRFGYAGNTSIGKFWQYSTVHIKNAESASRLYDDSTYPQYSEYTEICIDSLQYHKDSSYAQTSSSLEYSFPNSAIDLYSWERGDRVRIIASGNGSGTVTYLTTVYDYEIKAFDEVGGNGTASCLFIEDISSGTLSGEGLGANDIIEIYRPKKESSGTVFYEYGPLMEIYTDSGVKYHRGQTQDQDVSNDATGKFMAGDVYHIQRLFSVPINSGNTDTLTVESYSPSDFYKAEVWSQGKIGIPSSIGQTTSNNLIYSNVILEGTKINGLSDFEFDNYKEVTRLYGDVQAAAVVGSLLKIITDSVVITTGIGIREFTDANGQTTFASSDSVIGYQRVSQDHYGTIHPESVKVIDGNMYFWDYKNGVVVRDAGNGLFPISGKYSTPTGGADHKMRTFFKNIKETMRSNTYTNWVVWCAYERNYDLIYWYFMDTNDSTNNVIISYYKSMGRWFCSNYDWKNSSGTYPYFIGGGGRFFTSTIGETLWKHYRDDEEATYANTNVTEGTNITNLSASLSSYISTYTGELNDVEGILYIAGVTVSEGDEIVVEFEDDGSEADSIDIQIDSYVYLVDYNDEFLFDYDDNILIA